MPVAAYPPWLLSLLSVFLSLLLLFTYVVVTAETQFRMTHKYFAAAFLHDHMGISFPCRILTYQQLILAHSHRELVSTTPADHIATQGNKY